MVTTSFASCHCQELSDKKTLRDETTAQLKAERAVVAGWKHDKTLLVSLSMNVYAILINIMQHIYIYIMELCILDTYINIIWDYNVVAFHAWFTSFFQGLSSPCALCSAGCENLTTGIPTSGRWEPAYRDGGYLQGTTFSCPKMIKHGHKMT